MSDPILIVAALNGLRSRLECPNVPYSSDEIAAEAKRAVDAGAGIVHLHARKDDGSPAFDLVYDEIVQYIRMAVGDDVPISVSTQRVRQTSLGTITALFDVLRDPPDLASVNVRPVQAELPAHREEARQILESLERAGVSPEPSVFGVDGLGDLEVLYNDSLLQRTPYLYVKLGASQGNGGGLAPGTPKNMLRLVEATQEQFSQFPVVLAADDEASPIAVAIGAAAGVHVRVGFEDAATMPDGRVATSNAQLVELAVKVAESVGRTVMSPKDARALVKRG